MKEPLIAESAHKHGFQDHDILHAFENPILTEDLDDGFTMLVGPDQSGNFLEVGVVDSVDGPVIVHAMTARKRYLR